MYRVLIDKEKMIFSPAMSKLQMVEFLDDFAGIPTIEFYDWSVGLEPSIWRRVKLSEFYHPIR